MAEAGWKMHRGVQRTPAHRAPSTAPRDGGVGPHGDVGREKQHLLLDLHLY